MKYYENTKTGEVYAYETEEKRKEWGDPELSKMTTDEVDTHLNPVPTTGHLADTARAERYRLIESVRWRIERHNDELALGGEPTEPLEPLLQYTQALRDVPQQTGFPKSVEWPQCP